MFKAEYRRSFLGIGSKGLWGAALWFALTGLVPVSAAQGQPLPLQVRVELERPFGGDSTSVLGTARVSARPLSAAGKQLQAAQVIPAGGLPTTIPGKVTLLLERTKAWGIVVDGAGVSARARKLSKGDRSDSLTVVTRRRASLEVQCSLEARAQDPPAAIDLSLRVAGRAGGAGQRGWSATCTALTVAGRFLCEVPEGRLNIRVASQGHVPQYFWDKRVAAATNVPQQLLYRLHFGASVLGRVLEVNRLPADGAVVALVPKTAAGSVLEQPSDGGAFRAWRSSVDERGYFRVDGVGPGNYWLIARKGSRQEVATSVDGVSGRRTYEIAEPLILATLAHLDLSVDPPTAPSGAEWRLRLVQVRDGSRTTGEESVFDDQGRVSVKSLSPGAYELLVSAETGNTHYLRRATLEPGDNSLRISLNAVTVVGQVLQAGEPAGPLTLHFGGQRRPNSIHVKSDHLSSYSVSLPRAGDWTVDVTRGAPPLNTTLVVSVPEPRGETEVELDLEIPSTSLSGFVTSESEVPIDRVTVVVAPPIKSSVLTTTTTEGGKFEFAGLAPGEYTVNALAIDEGVRLTSETLRVEVHENEPMKPLELELVPAIELRGSVVDALGNGVVGAFVTAIELPRNLMVRKRVLTDSTGAFQLNVSPWAEDLALVALAPSQGFHFESLTRPFSRTPRLVIDPNNQGTLFLVGDAERGRVLLEDYAVGALLKTWAAMVPSASSGEMESEKRELDVARFLGMPRGRYSWCDEDNNCRSGFLDPGGQLVLQSP